MKNKTCEICNQDEASIVVSGYDICSDEDCKQTLKEKIRIKVLRPKEPRKETK